MITIKNIQNTATVTDGSNTIELGAGATYTCEPPSEQPAVLRFDTSLGNGSNTLEIYVTSRYGSLNWGDGTPDEDYDFVGGVKSHTYATGGVYDVTFNGYYTLNLSSTPSNDRPKFKGIVQFSSLSQSLSFLARYSAGDLIFPLGGIMKCKSVLSNAFEGSEVSANLDNITIDIREVTDLIRMFKFSDFSTNDLSYMKTGLVSRTQEMFSSAADFNSPSVAAWDLRNCGTFTNMFAGTSMDVATCDAILTGWQRWDSATSAPQYILKSNVSIHFGTTDYTRGGDAEDAHDYLVNTLNWTITFS